MIMMMMVMAIAMVVVVVMVMMMMMMMLGVVMTVMVMMVIGIVYFIGIFSTFFQYSERAAPVSISHQSLTLSRTHWRHPTSALSL